MMQGPFSVSTLLMRLLLKHSWLDLLPACVYVAFSAQCCLLPFMLLLAD